MQHCPKGWTKLTHRSTSPAVMKRLRRNQVGVAFTTPNAAAIESERTLGRLRIAIPCVRFHHSFRELLLDRPTLRIISHRVRLTAECFEEGVYVAWSNKPELADADRRELDSATVGSNQATLPPAVDRRPVDGPTVTSVDVVETVGNKGDWRLGIRHLRRSGKGFLPRPPARYGRRRRRGYWRATGIWRAAQPSHGSRC